MDIKQWKRLPSDTVTQLEVPSYKAVSVIELNGGRTVGSAESGGKILYWIVELDDSKIDSTFEILRDLRSKGMDFDDPNSI